MKQTHMKKTAMTLLSLGGLIATLTLATAAEEKTIKGEAQCAKCTLKEGIQECQTAIRVMEGAQATTYYLVPNKASKEVDKNVCTDKKQVIATGTVKEVNGKLEFTASKVVVRS